ncbi:MAG: cbb3-type cytochrome c oxidase subunit 3, partial [Xanthomonadales bacterium]|nr:cbb3-type cytochrome c oxidase subunit 3 [Xanthomonadales bacterium]
INLARGIVLILLIIAFLGIWAWAWSKKRKPEFHAASMLPLEEDDGKVPSDDATGNGKNDGKTQAGTKE